MLDECILCATPPSRCCHLPITLFRAERLLPHSHGTHQMQPSWWRRTLPRHGSRPGNVLFKSPLVIASSMIGSSVEEGTRKHPGADGLMITDHGRGVKHSYAHLKQPVPGKCEITSPSRSSGTAALSLFSHVKPRSGFPWPVAGVAPQQQLSCACIWCSFSATSHTSARHHGTSESESVPCPRMHSYCIRFWLTRSVVEQRGMLPPAIS
jgi:hypothetical protein